MPLVRPHNFLHPDDYLVLEDESGRVKIAGSRLSPSAYVTGFLENFVNFGLSLICQLLIYLL